MLAMAMLMAVPRLAILIMISTAIVDVCQASAGDQDPIFRSCVKECVETGCIESHCFPVCVEARDFGTQNASGWLEPKSQVFSWRMWDCPSECDYQCMIHRETQRGSEGQLPVQYHGKWPFQRILGLQEPASVVFSMANFAMHLKGWLSFLNLVYQKLPQKYEGSRSSYYEFTKLWIIYGLLSMNSWFWSTIFHSRDVKVTERMDYFSAVTVIGYTLIVALIRTCNLRMEATRVIVASPVIAFVSTHILYLNFYKFDYGLNMKICVVMGVVQLILWTFWGGLTQHPARLKLWFVVIAGASAMLLEVFDFPPIWGVFDAHSLWHAVTVPLTYYWWSFIKDDALFRTNQLTNVMKGSEGRKKIR